MQDQPYFNAEDWRLVLELLDREHGDLHPEIRHSQTTTVRADLNRRLKRVDHLRELIREALGEPG